VLSHPNSDHLNGLLYIAKFFNVKNAWTNNETAHTLGYRQFIEIIEKKDIGLPVFRDIPETQIINGVKLNILYPEREFAGAAAPQSSRNSNNNSLVLKVELGSKSFLFPGDIMEDGEKKLVEISGEKLESDVLVSPHHGSRTSSSELFLDMVKADVVIISAGWNNRYGFPTPEVLKRYKKRGCRVFRTDINGAVSMTTDGKSLHINPNIDFMVK
jgi:competence protein ComEC